MAEVIELIKDLIDTVPVFWVYLILFVSSVMENLAPPLPGDTITVFGAYLVGVGKLDFFATYLTTTAGSTVGFMIIYFIALKLGSDYFREKDFRFLPASSLDKCQIWFDKYGLILIGVNRFVTGARTAITIFAGITKVSWLNALVFSTISALIWNGLLIYLGFTLGENWQIVETYLAKYSTFVLVVLISIVIIYFVRKFLKNRQNEISNT